MNCPRCNFLIRPPRGARADYRPQCPRCGWADGSIAPPPEARPGLFGDERLTRAQGVRYLLLSLACMLFPLVAWNFILPAIGEYWEELRLLLGQYEPWRLPIYLAIVGLYLVAALVFRFGEDPDPAKEELYEALEGVMLFFVPGRWFWMALQGIVFGAA